MKISSEARRFGRTWGQVEFASTLSNPLSRPLGQLIVLWPIVLLVLAGVALTATTGQPPPSVGVLVAFYLVGVAVTAGVVALWSPRVEAKAFSAAQYKWLLSITPGSAGAYAQPDRKGRLTLYSVWAKPQGKKIGSVMIDQVLADTPQDTDLWLDAVNKHAAIFYARSGFVRISRGPKGIRMVLRRRPTENQQPR